MAVMKECNGSDQDLYILLTDTGTLFTRVIKSFTGAPYNHASIALDAELKQLYSFGRKRPELLWPAGFIQEDVHRGTFGRFKNTRCVVLRLAATKRQRRAVVRMIERFQEHQDAYGYNLLGLICVLLRYNRAPRNAFFCSQFVAYVLGRAGFTLWSRPPSLITPNDFLEHKAFEIVYTGYLRDYPNLHQDQVLDEYSESAAVVG